MPHNTQVHYATPLAEPATVLLARPSPHTGIGLIIVGTAGVRVGTGIRTTQVVPEIRFGSSLYPSPACMTWYQYPMDTAISSDRLPPMPTHII